MYTVKRITPYETLEYTEINIGILKGIGSRTKSSVTWAVVKNGQTVKATNGQFEIYQTKKTAQKVADYYNK